MGDIICHGKIDQKFTSDCVKRFSDATTYNKIAFVFTKTPISGNTTALQSLNNQFGVDGIINIFGEYGDFEKISDTSVFITTRHRGIAIIPDSVILVIERLGGKSKVIILDYSGTTIDSFEGDPFAEEIGLFIWQCEDLKYNCLFKQ